MIWNKNPPRLGAAKQYIKPKAFRAAMLPGGCKPFKNETMRTVKTQVYMFDELQKKRL